MLSRRAFLTAALLAPGLSWASTLPSFPRRLAVLNWGLAEMILALGVTPAGVSAPEWYRKLIPEPALPPGVQDLGLLFQPNLETLYALRPDCIVITPQHALLQPTLAQVAPTLTLPANGLDDFILATRRLGTALGREESAAQCIAQLTDKIARARRSAREEPLAVFLAEPVDALHLRLYTVGSLPGDVLAACGLRNAWPGRGGAEGSVLVELTRIATVEARLILLAQEEQRPAIVRWQQSPLWQRLPLTSRYPVNLLRQRISDAGALITAGRFADIFSQLMMEWRHV